ncbi:MAG: response regulator, partial [Candidatus Marinimicrobia bacterium]|nr:response regulator [Candidatus Neomarinimicrobiota bacterium]
MLSLTAFVIDDEESQRNILNDFLEDLGCEVKSFAKGEECLSTLEEEYADVVVTDYKMPGMDGIKVLKEIKEINPEIQVIIVTAYGTIENAVKAMKIGAWDYITKPIEMEELEIKLKRIEERINLVEENKRLKEEMDKLSPETEIVYKSKEMEQVMDLVGRISKRD